MTETEFKGVVLFLLGTAVGSLFTLLIWVDPVREELNLANIKLEAYELHMQRYDMGSYEEVPVEVNREFVLHSPWYRDQKLEREVKSSGVR